MITVVCFTWNGERVYKPEYVNTLGRMLAKYLQVEHRLVCITNDTEGFDPGIQVMPTPDAAMAYADFKTPEVSNGMPSCYRRLWVFSPEARILGERILLLDVDLIILQDITRLVRHTDDFVGWRPNQVWGNHSRVAGGMYLLKTGSHPEVWNDFFPAGIEAAKQAGFRGSDQAWLSYKLGKTATLWPKDAGLYATSELRGRNPPSDARIVQFAGHVKPWHSMTTPWVQATYPINFPGQIAA